MTTETEEFEFRRRREKEQQISQSNAPTESTFRDYLSGVSTSGGVIGKVAAGAAGGLMDAGEWLDRQAYKAGGAASELSSRLGAPPEVAGGIGTVANVGVQAIPMVLGGEAAKLVSPAFVSAAKTLMQSALKPTLKSLRIGEAATAIDTMLAEGINVSMNGVFKLKSKISDLNRQIVEAIQSSPATVNKMEVAKTLLPTLEKFQKQVNPTSDINSLKSAWGEFVNHPLLPKIIPEQVIPGRTVASPVLDASGNPFTRTIPEKVIPSSGTNEIPVQLAQELKQGTYKQLSGKYGELGSADTEAQKALARGLKEGIAKAVPEIVGLNAAESKLIATLNVAERRALMDANKNPAGLAWLYNHPTSFAAFVADRSPLFKSLLARMINAGREQIPATAARAGIGAVEAFTQN